MSTLPDHENMLTWQCRRYDSCTSRTSWSGRSNPTDRYSSWKRHRSQYPSRSDDHTSWGNRGFPKYSGVVLFRYGMGSNLADPILDLLQDTPSAGREEDNSGALASYSVIIVTKMHCMFPIFSTANDDILSMIGPSVPKGALPRARCRSTGLTSARP